MGTVSVTSLADSDDEKVTKSLMMNQMSNHHHHQAHPHHHLHHQVQNQTKNQTKKNVLHSPGGLGNQPKFDHVFQPTPQLMLQPQLQPALSHKKSKLSRKETNQSPKYHDA